MNFQNIKLIEPTQLKSLTLPNQGITFEDWVRSTAGSRNSTEAYYENVEVIFRCVDLRVNAVSLMPRQLERISDGKIVATANFPQTPVDADGRPLDEDVLLQYLDLTELLWQTEAALSLCRGAYWLKLKNRFMTLGARWMDPARVTPRYGTQGLSWFDYYRVLGTMSQPTEQLSLKEVCYIWRPSLREQEAGVSPAEAAMRGAGILYNADVFVDVYFQRGAMPAVLVYADENPGEQERTRLQKFFQSLFSGVSNAFRLEVLTPGFKFEQFTPATPSQIGFNEVKTGKKEDIAVAMGIPFTLLYSGSGRYASSSEKDDLHFYGKTIVPEAEMIARRINRQLLAEMGLRLRFRPDLLEVYQQQEAMKVTSAVQLFDRNAIDSEELRQAAGFAPRETEQRLTILDLTSGLPLGRTLSPLQLSPGSPPAEGEKSAPQPTIIDYNKEREEELRRFQKKSLKALKSGGAADVEFDSDWIAAWETETIKAQLATSNTAEEVKEAFDLLFFRPEATFR